MKLKSATISLALTLAAIGQAEEAKHRGLNLSQTESKITISDSSGTILVYNKQSPPVPDDVDPVYRRSGFIHPVATPAGRVVTAVFPKDHKHQNGIFSAWVSTTWNGRQADFWNTAGTTGRVMHEKVIKIDRQDKSVGFQVSLIHQVLGENPVDVMRETWNVTAHQTDGSYRCFDLETHQQALTEHDLTVNEYHYGGIALRGPVRWVQPKTSDQKKKDDTSEASNFLNDLGSDRVAGNHQKARWVSLYGSIDGTTVSISVLSHPDNFRAPQMARLHPNKPYFCYAPCVEGAFVINKDQPYRGKYRYLVTDEAPDATWLEAEWSKWVEAE